jgi:hypothetical protein
MKRYSPVGFFVVVGVVAMAAVVSNGRQWLKRMELRTAAEIARLETSELSRLEAENRRLRGQQISAEELAALRADHAALPRLRAELAELAKGAR